MHAKPKFQYTVCILKSGSKMNRKIIGERLRLIREQRDLLQEDLARIIGVTKGCVHSWEIGRTIPDPLTLYEPARILGVDINFFFHPVLDQSKSDYTLCKLTKKELLILNKIRAYNSKYRNAIEIILGVDDK